MSGTQIRLLHRLARLYGVEISYPDYTGQHRYAAPQTLLAVLRALGAPVERLPDVPDALRARAAAHWQRCCEPVAVVWEGRPAQLDLRLPAEKMTGRADCRLQLENGATLRWVVALASLPVAAATTVEGVQYERRQLPLPPGLPWGYHRLTLHLPARAAEVFIIAAPHRAYAPPAGAAGRLWGVFLPLYALRSRRNWGAGDFTDLKNLLRFVRPLGGGLAGTLPLLPAFLDEPFSPSPYEPVSRLFWNEFYLDIGQVPELRRSPEAQDLFHTPAFQAAIKSLRAAPLVDYRRGMEVKRRVLECCAQTLFAENSARLAALRRWAAKNPAVRDYARFRATVEKQRTGWPAWPDRLQRGMLQAGDYAPETARYHLYVQWLAHEQLQALAAQARENGQRLYLDLPVGVHRHGYDVWRERRAFVPAVNAGAPPDAFFTGGQDWGVPPLHPEQIREQGYRYYIACLRHHLRHAGILRLDHVMGLHRLYWVPRSLPAREGVYVRYRAGEFYAVLTLESRRHQALLVGEDLGTVPDYVRTAMACHQICRMYVLPFETTGIHARPLRPAPEDALACLNTHDMPPFAAYWRQHKKDAAAGAAWPVYFYRRGLLNTPTRQTKDMLRSCLAYLAAGRARLFMVNLEDLWLETAPQNVPGTTDTPLNWRRKTRYTLEECSANPEIVATLRRIDQLRKAARRRGTAGRFTTGGCCRPAQRGGRS